MPRRQATIAHESDREVIDINGFTSDESSSSSLNNEVPDTDTWQPPVLRPKPSRQEYEAVSLSN